MSDALDTAEPIAKQAHVWARDPHDWYVEPESATDALCTVERFVGGILDPACGGGNIVRALRRAGYDEAFGSDIKRRVADDQDWFLGVQDFCAAHWVQEPNIVMNPPFFRARGAESFIRKALDVARGKVCAFVDIRFLAGDDRAAGLYAEHPPHRVWIITPRVSCPPGAYLEAGGKAGNGSSDWCWLVWDKTARPTGTQIGWLRRNA
jgi:SAM-dependent methyltransferase